MPEFGDHSHLHIEFFTEPTEDPNKSRKEGRPVFDDTEYVRIKFVGDNKREIVAPAHDKFMRDSRGDNEWYTYAQMFPRHYEAFQKGQKPAETGTPIEELPFLTAAKRAELKALNVHTAEGLSGLDGALLQRLGMWGRQYKDQATAYLAKAKDTALETRMAAENAQLRQQLEALMAQVAQLSTVSTGATKAPPGPTSSFTTVESKPEAKENETGMSQFEKWDDESLKAFIKEQSGSLPRGTPSHATLVRQAEEAMANKHGVR